MCVTVIEMILVANVSSKCVLIASSKGSYSIQWVVVKPGMGHVQSRKPVVYAVLIVIQ